MNETFPSHGFSVRFWGVRGSVPTPGSETVRYGGNTACVEVMVAGHRLIFDGGTGLRVLGKHLMQLNEAAKAHIFFTHTHWDRIQGFPFFAPAFVAGNHFDVYGATAPNGASIKQTLMGQMLRPNFFTPLQNMAATIQFHNLVVGSTVRVGDNITIECNMLNPQTSALGFRVTSQGKSLVYATDSDRSGAAHNTNLASLAESADLLVYGGTYAEAEPVSLKGLSSETWKATVELAEKSQVKGVVLFHHNPIHDDEDLDAMATAIESQSAKMWLAREGMVLDLVSAREH